jgi:membrane protein DedA with SNARE-associated domain
VLPSPTSASPSRHRFTALAFSAASLDAALTEWIAAYGVWAPGIVALILFAKTRLAIAPFLPGAGTMSYRRFALFNVAGGVAWVALLVYAGVFLVSHAFVREHLSAITLAISRCRCCRWPSQLAVSGWPGGLHPAA